MAYQATVLRVMIASPADVSEERDIIRSVIHEWNDVNAEVTGMVLEPVYWKSHVNPELGTPPQQLINERILSDCDILIGVFWTRLGTPTPEYKSGTVEEVIKHIDSGKPAMVYFSSVPVAPETIDRKQFEKVNKFKAKCKELGIIVNYNNVSEFRKRLFKELQILILNNNYIRDIQNTKHKELSIEIVEKQKNKTSFQLTQEAIELLSVAASKGAGTIMKIACLGGRVIQVGGQQFGGENSRDNAKWESALNELVTGELVVPRGYQDQLFELTHLGWELSEEFGLPPKN